MAKFKLVYESGVKEHIDMPSRDILPYFTRLFASAERIAGLGCSRSLRRPCASSRATP